MSALPVENDVTRPSPEFLAGVKEKLAALRREREAEAATAPKPKPAAPSPGETSGYQRAAAVLAWFEPHTLEPLKSGANQGSLDQLLALSMPALDKDGKQRWTLLHDPRITALRELREGELLQQALGSNKRPTDDPLQQALEIYLLGGRLPVEVQSLTELATTYQVITWLSAAGFDGLPSPEAIARRTDRLRLLQTFEHLASDIEFRGRVSELQQLRSYAGVLPPGSLAESARRTLEAIFNWSQKPPLLIHGPGGVGKSTLVARFILEHARAQEQDHFPFVYLDFDRLEVDAAEPLTLLIEAVRQLGAEYPEAREGCERLRSRWIDQITKSREQAALESASVQSSAAAAVTLKSACAEFASLIGTIGATDRPVLFVLDTFEEVQWLSSAYVDGIWSMMQDLQSMVPRLRVVIAGRADIEGRHTQPLLLSGLDEAAAVGFLQARGIFDETIARRVARQIGGSPLSLKLAAELARVEGLDEKGRLAVTTHEFFFLRLDSALLQRQLYKRILTHVHNEDVRKLAYPGLVLRRITPDLILNVLAKPCGLTLDSLAQAVALFDELRREVSLVTMAPDGSLRHRQELRVVMLELLRADDADMVRAIQERAVGYYERRSPEPAERAEEIYHRLQLDQDFSRIDPRWIDGVERHLANAVEEFSGRKRAYLASHLGTDVNEETRRLADLQDWEKITERGAQALLSQDQPQRALELMRTRQERSKASPLVGLEGRALARLARWDEALAVIGRGFQQAVADGERSEALALALQAAEVVLASPRTDAAASAYARIAGIEAVSPIQQLEATIRMLAMVQIDPSLADKDPDLRERFRRLFDAIADHELHSRRTLGYWAATVFEPRDAERLGNVIIMCDLPRSSETDVRQLAGALAALDVAYSVEKGATPGALAHHLEIPPQSTVTAAWSEFLLRANDGEVTATLTYVLKAHADLISAPFMNAVAALMLGSLGIRREITLLVAAVKERSRGPTLRPAHREMLRDALVQAFSFGELSTVLRTRLGRNIEALVPVNEPFAVTVGMLLDAAENQGWVADLVAQAYYAQPNNQLLASVANALGITGVPGATGYEIDAIALTSPAFHDSAEFQRRLDELAAAVCRVEVGDNTIATGFLVGTDLLLTAGHVIADLGSRKIKVEPSAVRLRFDYREGYGGALVTGGTVFRLRRNWLVTWEIASVGAGLNYALLQVDGSPGVQPLGAAHAESSTRLRGWVTLQDHPAVVPGMPVLMMGHRGGGPLHASMGRLIGRSPDRTQVIYQNEAGPGSSGSPSFNADLQLISVHLGRDDKDVRYGAAIDAIAADLVKKGIGGPLGAKLA
jgi:hypothetical protein